MARYGIQAYDTLSIEDRSEIDQLIEIKDDYLRAYIDEAHMRLHGIRLWTHDFADCVSINKAHLRTLAQYLADGKLLGNTREITSEIRRIITDLENNGSQMRVYLHDLNSYAETGSMAIVTEVSTKPVDPIKLIKNVVRMVDDAHPHAGSAVIVDASPPGRMIVSDKHRITQIVSNLVRNAIRYAAPSDVRVTARFDAVDGVDHFMLVVEDDGPGIPQEDQERIFLRGEQSRPQEGGQKIGKGLGLYIVRELVNKLRGTIKLHSEVGKGTRFVVHLPVGDSGVDSPITEPLSLHH